MKIVSLDLCSDWMLARRASRARVLALSPLIRQYPVDWMDKDWPTHNGSLEQILKLQPDLVLTGEYNAPLLRQRLIELGLRVEVMALPTSLRQVLKYEQRFLSLLGLPANMATSPSEAVKVNTPARLLLLGANGIGTGRKTFEDDILQHAGWRNYIEADGYISLDLEQIVNDPPDAVMWSAPNSVALANLFAEHPALKRTIPSARWLNSDYWQWQCPGPWAWDLIRQLQQAQQTLQ